MASLLVRAEKPSIVRKGEPLTISQHKLQDDFYKVLNKALGNAEELSYVDKICMTRVQNLPKSAKLDLVITSKQGHFGFNSKFDGRKI